MFAAVTLWVHIRYTKDEWIRSPYLLRPLMLVGCFGQLAGVVAFAVYLALGITQHQSTVYFAKHLFVVYLLKPSLKVYYPISDIILPKRDAYSQCNTLVSVSMIMWH